MNTTGAALQFQLKMGLTRYNNYKFLKEDNSFTQFRFDLVPRQLFQNDSRTTTAIK